MSQSGQEAIASLPLATHTAHRRSGLPAMYARPTTLTDELHHAVREVVHRTGDLDRSFLLQVL